MCVGEYEMLLVRRLPSNHSWLFAKLQHHAFYCAAGMPAFEVQCMIALVATVTLIHI